MSISPVCIVSEYTRHVCVGVDVTRHHDLSLDIDSVVCHVQIDVVYDGCNFAVFYSDVESSIYVICWINDMAVFQDQVKLLCSSQNKLQPKVRDAL